MTYPTVRLGLVLALGALAAGCGDDERADPDAAAAADATPAPDAAPAADAASTADAASVADAAATVDAGLDADLPDSGPPAPPTAFRVTTLEILDPHLMAEDAGCAKADLTEFVNQLVAGSLTDQDDDGLLDFAPVMVFRPLAPEAASGAADFVVADCTATSPTRCRPGTAAPVAVTANNQASASCLGPLDGTTGGYVPPVPSTPGPCFATAEQALSLSLSGIEIALTRAQIAATYVGTPPTTATGGLLRGFMSEAAADDTFIEPLQSPLSALLPGSSSNGCRSDVDVVDGVRGWWFYLSFTAEVVAWSDD